MLDNFRPDISVIITAYNRTKFLEYSIDSVLQQNLKEIKIEIIVISNFDFTFNFNIGDVKFKKIVMEGTIGQFLHEGIKEASGDLVAFLDDDDLWEKHKLTRVIEAFSDKDTAFYHNMHSYIDSQGKPIVYRRKVEKNNLNSFTTELVFNPSFNTGALKTAIEMRADFNLSCIAVRKSLVIKYKDILKLITGSTDGFFFWTAVISQGYLFIDNLRLTHYRVHDLNTSSDMGIEQKVTELRNEINTFKLLINLLKYTECDNNYCNEIKKWLGLYMYEYETMALVLNMESRIIILKSLIRILRTGIKTKNTLKFRILAFGLIGAINPRVANIVYRII